MSSRKATQLTTDVVSRQLKEYGLTDSKRLGVSKKRLLTELASRDLSADVLDGLLGLRAQYAAKWPQMFQLQELGFTVEEIDGIYRLREAVRQYAGGPPAIADIVRAIRILPDMDITDSESGDLLAELCHDLWAREPGLRYNSVAFKRLLQIAAANECRSPEALAGILGFRNTRW